MLVLTTDGVIFKQDWKPDDRLSRAYQQMPTVTQAEEFTQALLVPPTLPDLPPPRVVEPSPAVHRLVEFFNR